MTENNSGAEKPTDETEASPATNTESETGNEDCPDTDSSRTDSSSEEPQTLNKMMETLGGSATMELDTVDVPHQRITTQLLRASDEPFAVEVSIDLGLLTAEIVLNPAATAMLNARLHNHVMVFKEAGEL
jgi:hypothetical protein